MTGKPAETHKMKPLFSHLLSRRLYLLLGPLVLAGCMVGPDYKRPKAIVSAKFKELQPSEGWKYAAPGAAEIPKGAWWTMYHDPVLNELEEQVAINNQNVKQYEARYRSARAYINAVKAQLYPTLSSSAAFNRQSTGRGTSDSVAALPSNTTKNNYSLGPSASWDLDLWGRIRRQIEGQVSETQASAADLANAKLSYQAQLASAYFNMRYQDSLFDLLDRNTKFYQRSYEITHNQYEAGTADPTTLFQSKTQLEQTRAQTTATKIARAQYEHAIAVFIGKAPADLSIPHGALTREVPAIPVYMPSQLLERRPDIAAAERRMEEYNAQIGAAEAAFYPQVTLSASYSYAGDPIGSLIQVANRAWSLGASASETLFAGGSRTADVRQAEANYDYYVANYRQTVLTALQNVEDQLSNLRLLAQQADQQQMAVEAANRAVQVSLNQYMAGTQIYTSVVTAEATALSNDQTALQIQQGRIIDSVSLIENLGGGWDASEIPDKDSMQRDIPLLPSFIQKDKNYLPNDKEQQKAAVKKQK